MEFVREKDEGCRASRWHGSRENRRKRCGKPRL